MHWKRFFRRMAIIQVTIFALVGVVCWLVQFSYGIGLVIAGCAMIVLAFTGSSAGSRMANPRLGSNTMEERYVRDLRDHEQIERIQGMMSDVVAIGLIPILIGFVLDALF